MIYGEPRLTLDVDLVVELAVERAGEFLDAFPEAEFYRPPLEVVRVECSRELRGHFNLIHHGTGMKADVYVAARDALHRWGLAHVRRIRFDRAFLDSEVRQRGLQAAWRRVTESD